MRVSVSAVSRWRKAVAVAGAAGGLVLGAAAPARANPMAEVASAADAGDPLDLFARVDYDYELDTSTLTRDSIGVGVGASDPIRHHQDLEFRGARHTITPRAELGVYHDTWLSIALPIIVTQSRDLTYASGVSAATSSTLRDGIVPTGGFDASDPTVAPGGDTVFRGPSRSGLDQLHLGLAVAPMNQLRDDTKPTWKLGAEIRLAIGKVARFDRNAPGSETGVGRGVHDLRLWTSVAKRRGPALGYFEAEWIFPLAMKGTSLFDDPGFGATNAGPGQIGSTGFGFALAVYEDAVSRTRVSLDVGSRIAAHFEGREYTEMWEALAFAGDTRGAGPLVLDRDPVAAGVQAISYPGISNVENYLETAASAKIRAELGSHARFSFGVDLVWKSDHAITFADAGVDLPGCSTGASPCETDPNDLVTPGTKEVNPLYVPSVDLVGHRYYSENNFGLVVGVQAQALF